MTDVAMAAGRRTATIEEISISRLVGLEEVLRLSTIPFLVEARDWARLPESFCREIERCYVVLQGEVAKLRNER